jgi:hypothetical protein
MMADKPQFARETHVPRRSLEERVSALEVQMTELRALLVSLNRPKDWRTMIGCFAGDELMMEIFEEGRKIREKDREKARRRRQTPGN